MLGVGWHQLPDDQDDGTPLPVSTFLDIDPRLGMRSPERLCRPYFKGRPQPQEIAQKATAWHNQGCRVQIGNEPNLETEGFGGEPHDYARWFVEVGARAHDGARLYWAGMSPGVPGWRAWYADAAIDLVHGIAAHAYGTFDQMREVVEFLVPLGKPIWLAEVNFGAGQTVDRDAWADDHLAPFLEYCKGQHLVEGVTYFSHRWLSPDMHLPTPVDGAGTGIERVLREFDPLRAPSDDDSAGGGRNIAPVPMIVPAPKNPPQVTAMPNRPTLPDLAPFATYKPLERNFDREGTAPRIAVWHGTAGLGDPYNWWNRSVPANQASSADFWISKIGILKQYVKLTTETSWSNGPIVRPDLSVPFLKWLVEYRRTHPGFTGNWWTLSIELEKDKENADPLTAAQLKTGNRLARWLAAEFAIPLDRTHHLGHYQFDSVNRSRCPSLRDAEWAKLLEPAGKTEPQIDQLHDQLWVAKDTAWALGRTRLGDDVMAAVRRSKGEIP